MDNLESSELDLMEQVMQAQLDLMNEQLRILKKNRETGSNTLPSNTTYQGVKSTKMSGDDGSVAQPAGRRSLVKHREAELSVQQKQALQSLTDSYCSRTKTSKTLTQKWRVHLADNRTVAGFNVLWKEMVYQIVAESSKGANIVDVDGNEYIDVTLCFGASLLGHSPDFVVNAVRKQLERGYEVGQQNMLAGDVSELICEMTGNERVTFAHSGCEAVQYAIRIARAVTGKDKIVVFENDIHGRGDSILARRVPGKTGLRSLPSAVGVLAGAVEDTLVLEYGSDNALEIIREYADQLAAVIVEPVRTRNPDLQPTQFLLDLRKITQESESLLIFDEVVMGFRVHPAGAQGYFDIKSDLAIYGKTIGGGMPIGVVAGKREYIDVVDGGMWQYGDDSIPEVGMTVSGGTMIKHPLAMAASIAFLQHLKERGPQLQENLNRRTHDFVQELNDYFQNKKLPIHIEHFSSYYFPRFKGDKRFEGLFYIYMRLSGIHIYMDYPCFLSTAHSDEDIANISKAFKLAAEKMLSVGFIEECQ